LCAPIPLKKSEKCSIVSMVRDFAPEWDGINKDYTEENAPTQISHGQVGWMPRFGVGEDTRHCNYIYITRKPRPMGVELHNI